jgi:Ca-activated chloride channel family protein
MFGIAAPFALLFIPAVLMIGLIVTRQQARRRAFGQKLGIGISPSPIRASLLAALPLIMIGIALLRPYAGTTEISLPSTSDDYMFVVDVSRSMYAQDVPPSRIELGKRKMKDLIAENKRLGRPTRYGITLFAGYSYLLCPLTDDTAVLQQFVSEISPEMVTSLGSNLEAGITTALSRFDERSAPNARILLISDGEDDKLVVDQVMSLIKEKKVRVDVLGVGTTLGTTITFTNGSLLRDRSGNVVQTKLNEESLEKIAAAGSGVYVRATLDDSDIAALTTGSLTPQLAGNSSSRTIRSFNEFGSWFALTAVGLIILSAGILPLRHIIRGLVFLVLPLSSAFATPLPELASTTTSPRHAYDLYNGGKYEEAEQAFEQLVKNDPTNRELEQSYASALFKAGKMKEAQALFNKLAATSSNGREYFENTYNEGNALIALRRYQDAIDAFTKALDIKPDDERALHNKHIAQALLEEEKSRPSPTPTPTPTPQPSQSPHGSPSASPSPEASSSPEQKETPKSSPQSDDSQQSNGEPSPNPDSSPSPGQETPAASPSPKEGDTPQPQATRLQENQPEDAPQQEPRGPTGVPTPESKSPSTLEAEAWLESLPESPLLVRQERGRAKPGGQTW